MELVKEDLMRSPTLNSCTLERIKCINSLLVEDEISDLFVELASKSLHSSDNNKAHERWRSTLPPSVFNDVVSGSADKVSKLSNQSIGESNFQNVKDTLGTGNTPCVLQEDTSKSNAEHIISPLQSCSDKDNIKKGEELIAVVKSDPDNTPLILSILSNLNETSLVSILHHAWNNLETETEREKLIIGVSSNKNATTVFCRHLLLPWVQGNHPEEVLGIYKCALNWFGNIAVEEIVSPILCLEDSVLCQDPQFLKELVAVLNAEQQHLVLTKALEISGLKLEKWQIPLLATIFESANFSIVHLERLINILEKNMDSYSQDRNIGKLLLIIIKSLTEQTSGVIVNKVVAISDKFKGPMRFRLKKLMKFAQNI